MTALNIRLLFTYLILLGAVGGMVALLVLDKGDEVQVWGLLGLIVGALIRDLASIQSAQSSEKIAESAIITETIRQDGAA